ncbi:MAG: radical SAM protein [Limisphaerales bacterium]|nr:MAG: radical SAM protein [Limisphaerales bacterium]KAG0510040.1 MAG: radical SAM protein [Limisphaerales bacterium]TXT53070.1 MAG: radical SAM protein [Limisphaerales bacterium]
MSIAVTEPPVATAPARSPAADFSKPVVRPKTSGWQLFKDVLNHGGPGYLQFAITNICNADCGFCGFARSQFDPKARKSVTLQEAKDVADIAKRNHIGYLLFVGGEPMAHRDLRAMVRYSAEQGIHPMICTNGGLWNDENMKALANDGLSSVIMSIDAHDVAKHEANRSLPDVCRKIKKANEYFHSVGIQTTASITASRLIEDYEKLPAFLESLSFTSCTFSYPLTNLASSYLSFSDSGLVNFNNSELLALFDNIKRMKHNSGYPVVNPTESLTEMQRHLRGEKEQFGCLGGHKYFYLDWNLDLYRCHAWDKPMCKVYEWDDSKLIRDGCTKCMIDCYRDPSVLQHVAINASDAWHALKKGDVGTAAMKVLDSKNLTSLKAVWEDRKWIGKV